MKLVATDTIIDANKIFIIEKGNKYDYEWEDKNNFTIRNPKDKSQFLDLNKKYFQIEYESSDFN